MAGPGTPGRKSKLTPELHEELVRRVRAGSFVGVAAQACGISRDTWQRWQRRGREETSGIYADLVAAMDEASAVAEAGAVAVILAAARSKERTQWQAAAWYLERRAPARWGRSTSTGVNADEDRGTPAQKLPPILYQGPPLSAGALGGGDKK